MPKCSVYSCAEKPIAGFEERIEISNYIYPRRTIPVGTYYWCQRHEELLSSVQGKIGVPIKVQAAEADAQSA